jgi:uncharacterized membrane protein YhaH (DUF805 family)
MDEASVPRRPLRRLAPLDRRGYLVYGLVLSALKFGVDQLVARGVFRRDWSLLDYLVPSHAFTLLSVPAAERPFYGTMALVVVPFAIIGVWLTARRLRDAGLPLWLVLLFFVPVVNYLVFAVLVVLGSRAESNRFATAPEPPPVPADWKERVAVSRFAPRPVAVEQGPLSYGHGTTGGGSGLRRLFPRNPRASAPVAIFLPVPFVVGLTALGVFGLRNYGWGLFVGMPFALGLSCAVLHGMAAPRSMAECLAVATLSTVACTLALFLVAMEGVVCLAMALPLTVPLALVGAAVGYTIQWRPDEAGAADAGARGFPVVPLVLLAVIPALLGAERLERSRAPLFSVTTSTEVSAPSAAVWRHVVSFRDLPPPRDWIFATGVAYPVRAEIAGRGPGAVRSCVFSTGSFVEPIEVWDEPRLLKFSVTSNPPAMRELSPYANLHPPHINDFLVSRSGQFELIDLGGGRTRLEGTTWYHHNMWPAAYWRLWSDFIIHRIHGTVLDHVKTLAEADGRPD